MPLAYVDSWDTAADKVVTTLITRIGTAFNTRFAVPLRAERTLVLDFLPPRVKVAGFFVGGGEAVAQCWDSVAPVELIMTARFQARFAVRADARAFGMMILSALPMQKIGNLVELRIAGNPFLTEDYRRLANDNDEKLYWLVTVPCTCVFRTDGEFA